MARAHNVMHRFLASFACAMAGCAHASATAPEKAAAPNVPTVLATYGTFVDRIPAQGRVGPPAGGESKLAFGVSGIVQTIDVHVGEHVVAGEALAQLDRRGFAIDVSVAQSDAAAAAATYGGGTVSQRAIASARAREAAARGRLGVLQAGNGTAQSDAQSARDALRQSSAKLELDRRTLARVQALYAGGVAAGKDIDVARQQLALDQADAEANRARAQSASASVGGAVTQAQADLIAAQADVRSAQAQSSVTGAQSGSARGKLASAQRILNAATLVAPADGVVSSILKHVGESTDPTQPVIVVGPPTTNVVTLTVVGSQANNVHAGSLVALSVPERGLRGTGSVRAIVPSVDPTTQTTTVIVDGIPRGSRPGDAVTATIDVGSRRGIIVPTSALVQDPQSGKTVVFVRRHGSGGSDKFVEQPVDVGTGDDRRTIITGGIPNGARIASEGAFDLLAPGG